MIVSEHLLNEVQDVLERPKMRRYLPVEEVPDYLDRVWDAGIHVSDMRPKSDPLRGVVPADPDDDYIPFLCIMGSSGVIVSGDHHLLDLETVCDRENQEIARVLTPREFLEQLKRER